APLSFVLIQRPFRRMHWRFGLLFPANRPAHRPLRPSVMWSAPPGAFAGPIPINFKGKPLIIRGI
ncbi:MAG TPA: hypothetical protein VHZ32_16690, partial [Rhizomicrobium sp.]|nr:hypothetical protein [Rhizomicrobium sp.]